ncbi:hypothetical protein, partial [Salmonella sp. SAL4432]|uniref:hypothetical protein n=1 Tax=Salmonella sp. SAL4432 TaxID=3159887 RepID=UPI00397A33BB
GVRREDREAAGSRTEVEDAARREVEAFQHDRDVRARQDDAAVDVEGAAVEPRFAPEIGGGAALLDALPYKALDRFRLYGLAEMR